MNKKLADYRPYEDKGIIPIMVFSPTIVNDGRRMLISSQPISYLTNSVPSFTSSTQVSVENVEFCRFLEKQDAFNLKFTSALRMNATFPYVMPMVTLPTEPAIDVMDAGVRDNYGMKTALQFLYSFKDWINTNTGGVILIQVRDKQKDFEIENDRNTIVERIFSPLGSFYSNFTKIQDYNADQLLQFASIWMNNNFEYITLTLRQKKHDNISLSWHLTKLEKMHILDAVNSEENKKAIAKLKLLLE